MKVWMVQLWHRPWVAHGYEPIKLFANEHAAMRFAVEQNARTRKRPRPAERPAEYYANQDEHTVSEWDVEP